MKSGSSVSFRAQLRSQEALTVWIQSQDARLSVSPEAYIAALLLPAMYAGSDSIVVDKALDQSFMDGVDTIQDIFQTWHPHLQRVHVVGSARERKPRRREGLTASFFTGGVDSFYSLIKHRDTIDALVYVHGFDVALGNTPLRRQVSRMVRAVGAQFDKEVIEIETNLREFSDRHAPWERYHGAALATVGLTLSEEFSHCIIPSSFPYNHLRIWGSHPLIDPLWSTDTVTFIHDGCEASRFEKCKHISGNEAVRHYLRVCWRNPEGAYNCGRCEKCIRTMTFLLTAGALDECSTFSEAPSIKRIKRDEEIQATIRRLSYQYLPALQALSEKPESGPLVEAIESAIQKTSLRAKVHTILHKVRARARRVSSMFLP